MTASILNLTSPIVFRSTRKVVGCDVVVRDVVDKRFKKCQRKPSGLGYDDATMKMLQLSD